MAPTIPTATDALKARGTLPSRDTFGRAFSSVRVLKFRPILPDFSTALSTPDVPTATIIEEDNPSSMDVSTPDLETDPIINPTRLFTSQSVEFSLSRQPSLSSAAWNTRLFGNGGDFNGGNGTGRNRSCSDLVARAMAQSHPALTQVSHDSGPDSDFDVTRELTDGDSGAEADLEEEDPAKSVGIAKEPVGLRSAPTMDRIWESTISDETLALDYEPAALAGQVEPWSPYNATESDCKDTPSESSPYSIPSTQSINSESPITLRHGRVFVETRIQDEDLHPSAFQTPPQLKARPTNPQVQFAPDRPGHSRKPSIAQPAGFPTTMATPYRRTAIRELGTRKLSRGDTNPDAVLDRTATNPGNVIAQTHETRETRMTEDREGAAYWMEVDETTNAFHQLNATLSRLLVRWCEALLKDATMLDGPGLLDWRDKIVMGAMVVVVAQVLIALTLMKRGSGVVFRRIA